MVADEHPQTEQLQATTAYRYTGANPDNYVSFNDELWRIIGVFDVDDGTGNLEQRIKLISKGSFGNIQWDRKTAYTNKWSDSSCANILNSGGYWNRTGSYESTGLTADAKEMISDAKWYLGGTGSSFYENSNSFYANERGKSVWTSTIISWIGKVGLIYPSDYGYATSGGTTTNRTSCIAKAMYGLSTSSYSDCKNNNWLHDSSNNQWTLTPSSADGNNVHYINKTGKIDIQSVISYLTIRPSVYLSSNIKITGGTGTESDPYQLSL